MNLKYNRFLYQNNHQEFSLIILYNQFHPIYHSITKLLINQNNIHLLNIYLIIKLIDFLIINQLLNLLIILKVNSINQII